MRNGLIVLALLATAFAGCAGEEAPQEADPADELDLEATATTGVIRGLVVDQSINPLMDAVVTLQGTQKTMTTGADGLFGFDGLEPSSYIISVERLGYAPIKSSATVEAGVDKPPLVRVLMERVPGSEPHIVPLSFNGHLTCGVAIFVTSVGCTTLPAVAGAIGDQSIFYHSFDGVEPDHIQGELVWRNNQPLAGKLIWEIVGDGNSHIGYRETEFSPALAYVNATVIEEQRGVIMDEGGIAFRYFGGPMDGCEMPGGMPPPPPPFQRWSFGCGATIDQSADVYAHVFYNFSPVEDWRFTYDGDHPIPS